MRSVVSNRTLGVWCIYIKMHNNYILHSLTSMYSLKEYSECIERNLFECLLIPQSF